MEQVEELVPFITVALLVGVLGVLAGIIAYLRSVKLANSKLTLALAREVNRERYVAEVYRALGSRSDAVAIGEYADTGTQLRATLESRSVTLDDTILLLGLIRGLLRAAEDELLRTRGLELALVPELVLETGSLRIIAKLKASVRSLKGSEKQAIATIVGAVILAAPSAISHEAADQSGATLSNECRETVENSVHDFVNASKFLGRDFEVNFDVSCGNVRASATIKAGK